MNLIISLHDFIKVSPLSHLHGPLSRLERYYLKDIQEVKTAQKKRGSAVYLFRTGTKSPMFISGMLNCSAEVKKKIVNKESCKESRRHSQQSVKEFRLKRLVGAEFSHLVPPGFYNRPLYQHKDSSTPIRRIKSVMNDIAP
jgi:hypothetical protein